MKISTEAKIIFISSIIVAIVLISVNVYTRMNPPAEVKPQYDRGYEDGRAAAYEYVKDEIRDRLSGEDQDVIDYFMDW